MADAQDTHPRIVVGVDGSDSSKEALRWAARQAKLTGAALEVVVTWEYPTSFGWAPPYPADLDLAADARHELDEDVASVLGEHPGIEVRTAVVEGHPAPTLLKMAATADLLVVGSRGHGGFAGLLLGSVGEYCVTHATCPVVVVRHPHQ
ncbi:MAG: universal stress protein [Acidimicrobiales bacterium]